MIKRVLTSCTIIICCLALISWGEIGHRTVGEIAQNYLSNKAKKALSNLIGNQSLALQSTYADEIRPLKDYAYTAPWHYVNLKEGLNYDQFSALLKSSEMPNIYQSINTCIADLKDASKTKEQQDFALKFLIHLVGDIHQPMHTGHSEDAGGNGVKVKFMRKENNLHALWDSGLINYTGMTYTELAKTCNMYSKDEVKAFQKDDITLWAFESYKISNQLYAEANNNTDYDYNYYAKHENILKQRLAQAGIRLAGILNEIYK